MMLVRWSLLFLAVAVVSASEAKSLPDNDASVVSVYTTLPTTSGAIGSNELDVYQQIANNLAERITTPFYRFFGLQRNKTETDAATTKNPEKIELLDEDNDEKTRRKETKGRDVEELSVEALNKKKEKPEKVTLYNSYLPQSARIEANDTVNEVNIDNDEDDIDDFNDLTLDDITETVREGPIIYFLEWIASAFQIAWGALSAIFKPSST